METVTSINTHNNKNSENTTNLQPKKKKKKIFNHCIIYVVALLKNIITFKQNKYIQCIKNTIKCHEHKATH